MLDVTHLAMPTAGTIDGHHGIVGAGALLVLLTTTSQSAVALNALPSRELLYGLHQSLHGVEDSLRGITTHPLVEQLGDQDGCQGHDGLIVDHCFVSLVVEGAHAGGQDDAVDECLEQYGRRQMLVELGELVPPLEHQLKQTTKVVIVAQIAADF